MAYCISVIPRCKPVCQSYCDIPNPRVVMLDSGFGADENRIAYMGRKCKLQVSNHNQIVDAGYSYDYQIYAPDANLSSDGTITWTEPSWGGGNITITLRQLLFRFYKDDKCWSSLVYTIYPKKIINTLVWWWDTDGDKHIIDSSDPSALQNTLYNEKKAPEKVHILHIKENVTSMYRFMFHCNKVNEFICDGDTSNITDMQETWSGCSSLTSFPHINTSSVTNMSSVWSGCSSLTSFPLIDTSSVTNMSSAWEMCSSLTSFPHINTSSVTKMERAWGICLSLPLGNCGNCNNGFKHCHYLFDDGVSVPSGDGDNVSC